MEINNYFLFRELSSILFLFDLIAYTPFFSVFFGQGYNEKSFLTKSFVQLALYFVWLASIILLIFGIQPLLCSLVLFTIFRHFFINNRWKSLFRGGGAPGFISHYVILFILLFELSFLLDPTYKLSAYINLLLKIDFGVIILCAGAYKSLAGYLKNNGMEYGLANPMWGYSYSFF